MPEEGLYSRWHRDVFQIPRKSMEDFSDVVRMAALWPWDHYPEEMVRDLLSAAAIFGVSVPTEKLEEVLSGDPTAVAVYLLDPLLRKMGVLAFKELRPRSVLLELVDKALEGRLSPEHLEEAAAGAVGEGEG